MFKAKVWESAAEVAKVFRIGKSESGAILNLTTKVHADMVIKLRDSVRTRGMRAFLNHDCIARDLFNLTFTTGTAGLEPWASQLMNREDNQLVSLVIDRMCGDFDRQAPSMRKPWTFKDASSLHAACGAFQHFMRLLQRGVSQADFQRREANLKQQFALGVFDPDLLHAIETTVPPSSLESVGFLRRGLMEASLAAEISQQQARDVEERNRELAERVAAATMDQIRAKLEADIEELKKHVPSAEKEAIETSLDMKYTFATLDATVFPSNAMVMKGSLEIMSSLLNMGVQNIAHIQLPIPQSNTTLQALTKHRRTIEDYLLSHACASQTVGLHLTKPNDAHGHDKRGCLQGCVACYFDSRNPPWNLPILIGPVELIRVSDMLGYDEVNRPGATARAEQTLGYFSNPNQQHAEFARAIVKRKLSGKAPDVSYFGVVKDTQKDVIASIEEEVYNAWDNSSAAPSKTRVRDAAATYGSPKFPDALLAKFPEGSPQHKEIVKFKEQVKSMFPASENQSSSAVTVRAAGLPDFSGENLLDLEREVSLETIGADEFNQEELASCPGKPGKPAIMLTKDYKLFLGNITEEEMVLASGELFGFNVGAFEIKLIAGPSPTWFSHAEAHARETKGLPHRFREDSSQVLGQAGVIRATLTGNSSVRPICLLEDDAGCVAAAAAISPIETSKKPTAKAKPKAKQPRVKPAPKAKCSGKSKAKAKPKAKTKKATTKKLDVDDVAETEEVAEDDKPENENQEKPKDTETSNPPLKKPASKSLKRPAAASAPGGAPKAKSTPKSAPKAAPKKVSKAAASRAADADQEDHEEEEGNDHAEDENEEGEEEEGKVDDPPVEPAPAEPADSQNQKGVDVE
eukprot:s2906_g8.t1